MQPIDQDSADRNDDSHNRSKSTASSEASPSSVRRGSPFASGTATPTDPTTEKNLIGSGLVKPVVSPEAFYDFGPTRYTAMGAVAASIVVIFFAAAAALWFPGGGVLIAGLGCALSIFGLASPHRILSSGLLACHVVLFMTSYARSLA